ncbi:MAG: hypothetical protein ACI9TY_001358 [Alphaproteobacteria bacterium]|jgi:hypothetical protein
MYFLYLKLFYRRFRLFKMLYFEKQQIKMNILGNNNDKEDTNSART